MPRLSDVLTNVMLQTSPLELDVRALAVFRAGETSKPLSEAEKKDLIERSRAGEHVVVEADAETYIQGKKPNLNFVRFREGALSAIAKSGKGTPLLRDHAQQRQADRGGTVLASKMVKREDGSKAFSQRLRFSTPWSVQGVLEGTIDRFSIGFHPRGPVRTSHDGKEIEGWPDHWPGDELEDGTVVEWVFDDADLVETSSVNVPAVAGTGVGDVRATLSAHLGGSRPSSNSPRVAGKERKSMERLMKRLGLSADASEDSALAALEELEKKSRGTETRAEAAELELKAEREAHDGTKTKLAEFEKREKAQAAAQLDAAIAALYEEGKLVHGRSVDGKEAQPDSYEATLREVAEKLGLEKFEAAASRLSPKVPVGPAQSDARQPAELSGTGVIPIDEGRRARMRSLGLRESSYQHAPGRFDLSQIPPMKADRKEG